MAELGYEIGWDDSIENEGPQPLPAGDYDFTVMEFERGRFAGSDKLPPCNKAILTIRLEGLNGESYTVRHNLYLHSTTEGLLCAFFTSIGQRRHGERVTMNWNTVIGAKGRAKVGVRTYKNKSDEDITTNEIKKFYKPDPNAPATSAPLAEAPAFEPGRF